MLTTMNCRPIESRTRDAAAERWRLADEAARAQARGRDGIAALAVEVGRPKGTLRRWARVARQFPAGARRPGLTFSHHEALAGLEDRLQLAERAEREHWTVAETKDRAMLAYQDDTGRTAMPCSGVVRRGPEALDVAIEYLQAVQRAGGHGDVVRARAQVLATLAQAIADAGPATRWPKWPR
jgi:hypothetical protein